MFLDRRDAGKRLAAALSHFKGEDVVVCALPRGGVIVGAEIAKELKAPMELILVRKIGHPYNPEYAIGAVSEDGQLMVNQQEVASVDRDWFEAEVKRQIAIAKEQRKKYLGGRPPISLEGRKVIVVDDGIATGYTVRASIRFLRKMKPARIVVAVPVAPSDTVELLRGEADEVIVTLIPEFFVGAIGAYYEDFTPVSDEEVIQALESVHEYAS